MFMLWIAGLCLVLAAAAWLSLPLVVLGPRQMILRGLARVEGQALAGGLGVVTIALVFMFFAMPPLISAGDPAGISAENFHRLSWNA